MQITAAMVKELRERTSAGMMECKKALTASGGDMEAAVEAMRKSGAAQADKVAGRIAADGVVVIAMSDDGRKAALVEVNCQTDFVAKDEGFAAFSNMVAEQVLTSGETDVEALSAATVGEHTIEEQRQTLIGKIGENVKVRRVHFQETEGGVLGAYQHGVKIGVLTELAGGDQTLAKDISMHVAASRPVCVAESDVPADLIEKEKEIFTAQAIESGKPPEIAEKMVTGRLRKYLAEITLLGQPFVKDPDQTVEKLLAAADAKAVSFTRFEVGEGIEVEEEDFAAEVMKQVKGDD